MIGYHCGQRLQRVMENRERFTKQCRICGKTFTQKKRLSAKQKGRR